MKICAIGDPHGDLRKIKKIPLKNIDLIILTGDLGKSNLMRKMAFLNIERKKCGFPKKVFSPAQERKSFMEAYNSTLKIIKYLKKFAPLYIVYGNVESSNYETRKKAHKIGLALPYLYNELNIIPNVRVLNNRVANFKGLRIGGLKYFLDVGWVKKFKPSDYIKKLMYAKKETNKAKTCLKWFNSLDILICHQPPFGVLDKVASKSAPKHWDGKHAGSLLILKYIKTKFPKYVFCGHIHEGQGKKIIYKTKVYNLGLGGYKIIEF